MPRCLHPLGITATPAVPEAAPDRRFRTARPGRLPYCNALALQESLLERRPSLDGDVLVLLEHPPVITLGRRSGSENLLASPDDLARRGIEISEAGRGGDVTYHGPGQLVGYPIVDLTPLGRDLHDYLRRLEEVIIRTLAAYDLPGERVPGKTGVWVGGEKIASIGVGVRRWISWHGFALNVSADLSGFRTIVPCGLPGVRMTSLETLLGRPVPMSGVQNQVVQCFEEVFSARYAGELAGIYDPSPSQETRLA